jgi:hypothetical protein
MSQTWEGRPTRGLEFFQLLRNDDEFCAELGRAVLAAGRLESALIRYLHRKAPDLDASRATLGRLISFAEQKQLLLKLVPALRQLSTQRNYLAHSLHALFSGLVEETLLPASDLLDSDVSSFTDRAWMLRENLEGLSNIVEAELP